MGKTVQKKRNIRMPDSIRKKLSAAFCMLLISAIMLVSSTYAWFTLSTAPEVSGITTNVGANGNLEIALLNKDSYISSADDLGIISKIGDSMDVTNKNVTEANETWGNLVDLSDASYGFQEMTLMPARLNVLGDNAPYTIDASPLMAPSYGADGRVIEVKTNTMLGKYTSSKFLLDEDHAGARVIGVSSGTTVRISAYRQALSAARTAMTSAKTTATGSLNNYGGDIANIMMNYVTNKDNATYTAADLTTLQNIITSVTTANSYVETAIKNALLAYHLSAANAGTISDAEVSTIQSAILNMTIDSISTDTTYTKPDGLTNAITLYNQVKTNLETAKTRLTELVDLSSTSYTWEQISYAMSPLVNQNGMKLGDKAINEINDNNLGDLISDVVANAGATLTMGDGSGVYYDIAKMCGSYTVNTMMTVNYAGTDMHVNATINVTAADPIYLSQSITAITAAGQPAEEAAAGTVVTISDPYGYMLDFGFRTNAAGSNLQLQTSAINRVYGADTSNTDIVGLGSWMAMQSSNPSFTTNDVRGLMSAIRVAFVTPDTTSGYQLLAVGALDITSTTDNQTGITTYSGGTEENGVVKADLNLYEYSVTTTTDGGQQIVLGNKKTDATLTALEQNKAKKISVIVYLDGDIVDNTMVANAATSMTGSLNLQFSSSASLMPMENSKLRYGNSNQ